MTIKHSPFSLLPEAESAYQQWRAWKLSVYPKKASELLVSVKSPFDLAENERAKLGECFLRANMAIYTINIVHFD